MPVAFRLTAVPGIDCLVRAAAAARVRQLSWVGWLFGCGLLFSACAVAAPPPAELQAFRSVTGGAAWDGIRALRYEGTLEMAGLQGELAVVESLQDGRYRSAFSLGPLEGAEGFDGERGWRQDPGGERVYPDAESDRRAMRTQVWLVRRGYWDDAGATYGPVRDEHLEGIAYRVVTAHPDGGLPIELWLDAGSRLLTRTLLRQGQDTVVTTFSDYREQAGLMLPYRADVDRGDARNRMITQWARIEAVAAPTDADFTPDAQAQATTTIVGGGDSTVVPFALINNHIYVEARIDDQPVTLLVDTGGVNALTPAAARRLGLDAQGRMAARGVGEQQADVGFARADAVQLGEARLDDPLFYVIDFGNLSDVEGLDVDGLLGFELFHRYAVRIDYAAARLTLMKPDAFEPPAQAVAVPFELEERTPVVQGSIDGLPARLAIDTGARNAVTLHSPFVREHGLVDRYDASLEAVTGWGVGGPVRGRPVRLGELRLGTAVVEQTLGDLYTGDRGSFADPNVSANIGSGLLRRFVVDFDYGARTMYLRPGADHDRRQDYDRLGAWINRDRDALMVAAVTAGGPAERAGLRAGDRLLTIDGIAVADHALTHWREWLGSQPAGRRIAIDVERTGRKRHVVATLEELLPPAK